MTKRYLLSRQDNNSASEITDPPRSFLCLILSSTYYENVKIVGKFQDMIC